MIGANHLSALYIKLVRSYSPNRHRVVAVIDDEISLFGRRVAGVPVVSTIAHIEHTIEEFEVHGVCIDRIIVGGDDALLPKDLWQKSSASAIDTILNCSSCLI